MLQLISAFTSVVNQSINQSMAVTDAGTKVPLCPYHTFYTLLIFKIQSNNYLYTQIGLQFRQDQLCNQKQYIG